MNIILKCGQTQKRLAGACAQQYDLVQISKCHNPNIVTKTDLGLIIVYAPATQRAPHTVMGGRKLPDKSKTNLSSEARQRFSNRAPATTKNNQESASASSQNTHASSNVPVAQSFSTRMGNSGEVESKKRPSTFKEGNLHNNRGCRAGTYYDQYSKKLKGSDQEEVRVNETNSIVLRGQGQVVQSKVSASSKRMSNCGQPRNEREAANFVEIPQKSIAQISEVDLSSIGNFSAGTTWNFLSNNGKMNDDDIKLSLGSYVKQKIFPHLKFIPGPSWIDFNTQENSLCGRVLRHLAVPTAFQDKFWRKYGRKVETYLGSKRNDTATALKCAFFSK